jgi:hypothetical protein
VRATQSIPECQQPEDIAEADDAVLVEVARAGRRAGIGVEVLHRTADNPAVYEFRGDELYVRAKVTSSKLHPNPYAQGDRECAWVQPVVP